MKWIYSLALAIVTLSTTAVPAQQQLQYFGYAYGGETAADLSLTKFYTNFSQTNGVYNQSIVAKVNAMTAANVQAIVDLGQVLWCLDQQTGLYHLCGRSRSDSSDYVARWSQWKSLNQSVLNSNQVLAFQVITEPSLYMIPDEDVDIAARLVKGDFPAIKTTVIEALKSAGEFRNSTSVDWVGLDIYGIHPLTDSAFNQGIATLKTKMFSNQKIIYVMDGYWQKTTQGNAGLCPANMGQIAYEWYRRALQDSQAVALGVFLWPSSSCPPSGCGSVKCTDTCPPTGCPGIGSKDLPQSTRDAQIAIGRAILGHSQGYLDGVNCQSIFGWDWYSDEPNTPITVDLYSGSALLATVNANLFRQDLLNAGKGNGYHGFTYNLPNGLRDNHAHSISANYGGTPFALSNSPRTITCPVPSAWIAWIKPSEVSWGPPGTLTAAGFALNGAGGVQMVWRDSTANGSWNTVAYQPNPAGDGSWSNTIPAPVDKCHNYDAYVNYSGIRSSTFTYNGLTSGYCTETVKIIWIQPQASAGFGPPGSLVVAGSATNAPSSYGVNLWWKDVTLGTGWNHVTYAPIPDSNGIWYNSIPSVNYSHQYSVYVKYDVLTSNTCTYFGNNQITWCQ